MNYFKSYDITLLEIKKEGAKDMKKHDKSKIATRILAGVLVALMLLGSIGTVLYYIFA